MLGFWIKCVPTSGCHQHVHRYLHTRRCLRRDRNGLSSRHRSKDKCLCNTLGGRIRSCWINVPVTCKARLIVIHIVSAISPVENLHGNAYITWFDDRISVLSVHNYTIFCQHGKCHGSLDTSDHNSTWTSGRNFCGTLRSFSTLQKTQGMLVVYKMGHMHRIKWFGSIDDKDGLEFDRGIIVTVCSIRCLSTAIVKSQFILFLSWMKHYLPKVHIKIQPLNDVLRNLYDKASKCI